MIKVTYRFPPGVNAEKQAQVIAVGQTVGSWGAQFAHREAQLKAHLAHVLDVTPQADNTSLARIGFPRGNTEDDIATLLTMIFGKFSLAGPARIVDIELPANYGLHPKFGLDGIRDRTGVHGRPFVMGIFKPALGLTAQDHALLLRESAGAGLDIIKDDEINFDLGAAPTLERTRACREVIDEIYDNSGRTVLYAVNVSGRADKLVDNARRLIDAGANALLLNVLCYGYSCLEALAAHADIDVPIFTHPALSGALGGATDGSSPYGIDYAVTLGTLMAHGGADAVLYPAHYGSLPFARETEFRIRDILREPIGDRPRILPVPSAGIHPGVVGRAVRDYGNDVALNAGAAIFDHPNGIAAGVQAFFDALAVAGDGGVLKAEEVADGPLKVALQKWGGE